MIERIVLCCWWFAVGALALLIHVANRLGFHKTLVVVTGPTAAAWATFIATLLAAGVAIWVIRYQLAWNARATLQAQRRADADRIESRALLIEFVMRAAKAMYRQAVDPNALLVSTGEMLESELAADALEKLPLDSTTNHVELLVLLALRKLLSDFRSLSAVFLAPGSRGLPGYMPGLALKTHVMLELHHGRLLAERDRLLAE